MQKLPVLRLVRHAYLDVIANWRGLVQVGGLWLLGPWLFGLMGAYGVPLLGLVGGMAMAIGLAAVAVAWHRHILLGEPLAGPAASVDVRVGRYLLWTILLGLLMSLPLLIVGPLVNMETGTEGGAQYPPAAIILLPLMSLLLIWVVARLQLIFPGTAVEQKEITFAKSWEMTKGHGVRLVLALILVAVPVAIMSIALMLLFSAIAQATGSIIMHALADLAVTASAWVQAPLVASLLSFTYLFLRERRGLPEGMT